MDRCIHGIEKEVNLVLPYIQLDVEMGALQLVELPAYTGSTLRGALWAALKSTGCMSRMSRSCEKACALPSRCLYGSLCETPHAANAPGRIASAKYSPHPIQITPAGEGGILYPGDKLRFQLTLYGEGRRRVPEVIASLARMAQLGVGKGRGELALTRVQDTSSRGIVWSQDAPDHLDTKPLSPSKLELGAPPSEVDGDDKGEAFSRQRLKLTTPLLMTYRKKEYDHFDLGAWVYSVVDRMVLLCCCHGEAPHYEEIKYLADAWTTLAQSLHIDVSQRTNLTTTTRYSGRQKRKHELEGLRGLVELTGNIEPLYPIFHLAHMLHIGKKTSFGFGQTTLLEPRFSP